MPILMVRCYCASTSDDQLIMKRPSTRDANRPQYSMPQRISYPFVLPLDPSELVCLVYFSIVVDGIILANLSGTVERVAATVNCKLDCGASLVSLR